MNTLHSALHRELPPQGIDLIQEFPLERLQKIAWTPSTLPATGTGWVIGNTRALWEPWIRVMRNEPARQAQTHPLDQWITEILTEVVGEHDPEAQIFYAHTTEPAPVPMQQIAQLSGLASLSPAHLCAHPIYGPWMGLRALVVSAEPTTSRESHQKEQFDPCASCEDKRCGLALHDAKRDARRVSGEITAQSVRDTWRAWVAIREACPVGREHQYTEAQLHYHYLQDRSVWDTGV